MALELGKTAKWITDNMSMTEILKWWRYYCEYPFGYYRNDLREALNCAVSAAPHSRQSLPLSSFALFKDPIPEPSPEELAGKIHKIFGGLLNG